MPLSYQKPLKHCFLIASLLAVFTVSAQNKPSQDISENRFSISGKITDGQSNPLPFASVALFANSDSTLTGSAATDDKGDFIISALPGSFHLKISFLSFREKTVSNINVSNENVALENIIMQPGDVSLDEVEVQAEKSQMQLQLDKRVFNVGSDISNTGSNALEVLENIPSVTVDMDGNVSLRGSQNVRILIDGKPSGLVGISGNDALRQLQANMIERVEVITNPSARYDAEGESGIINIVLKKDSRKGVNGSFDVTAGYPHNYGASFNINYRKNKVNLFTGYGLNFRRSPGSGYTLQQFSGDTTFSYERDQERTRGGLSSNVRGGIDFYLNEFNTLTASALYRFSKGMNDSRNVYVDYDSAGNLVQTVVRTEDENEDQHNIEASLRYRKTFNQKGREFTADFKWNDSDDIEHSDLLEKSDSDTISIIQRSDNVEDERTWLAQADYTHPFKKEGKLETGIKGTLRKINNDYTVEEQAGDGSWHVLPAYDNNFIYTENIYAAYVIAGSKVKNFSCQVGLRGELSDVAAELVVSDSVNSRLYFGLFPNAHLSYELKKRNTLQLSYSRRLSRPNFRNLLPFFSFSDSRNNFTGNPNLDREYTHSLEFGHLKYWEKGSLLSNIYYRHRTGVIERIIVVDSAGFTSIFPINLSTQNAFGIELSSSFEILKWWRLTGNLNFNRAITDGEYQGESLNSDTYWWSGRLTSKMTFFKKLDTQISFDYRSPLETTQGKSKAMYAMDAGLSMDVLKGNGTVTFSGRDLFNTRKRRAVTEGVGYHSESEFQWSSRQFMLGFSYRLNQKKKKDSQRGFEEGSDDTGF